MLRVTQSRGSRSFTPLSTVNRATPMSNFGDSMRNEIAIERCEGTKCAVRRCTFENGALKELGECKDQLQQSLGARISAGVR